MKKSKSFDEILEIIKSDEKSLSKFLKEDDTNKIYKTFKQYCYLGTVEDIQNETLSKLHSDSISSEVQPSNIAGGKMNFKKEIASAMSTLALMGTVMPSTGATSLIKSQPNKVSSNSEMGTLEKIKCRGSQSVEKAKEYRKTSENKIVKYGLVPLKNIMVLVTLGYWGYRLLVGGKVVETHTKEVAELIAAITTWFDYTLSNYSKLYDSHGNPIENTPEKKTIADELTAQIKTKWNEFVKAYPKNLKKAPNDGEIIAFLKNQLEKISGSETPEGKDCKTLLDTITIFELKMKIEVEKAAKEVAEKVAKEATREAELYKSLYDFSRDMENLYGEVIDAVSRKLNEMSNKISKQK